MTKNEQTGSLRCPTATSLDDWKSLLISPSHRRLVRSPSTPYSCLTDVLFRSPRKTLLVFPSHRHFVEVTLGTAMFSPNFSQISLDFGFVTFHDQTISINKTWNEACRCTAQIRSAAKSGVCVCVCGAFSCTKAASRPVLECLRCEHEQGDQGCLTWPGPTKLQVLRQDMAEGRFSHVPALDDKLLVYSLDSVP